MKEIGIKNIKISLLEDTKSTDIDFVWKREQWWIDLLKPMANSNRAHGRGETMMIICECGSELRKRYESRHFESKNHIHLINIKEKIINGKDEIICGHKDIGSGMCICECYFEMKISTLNYHRKTEIHKTCMQMISKWRIEYKKDIIHNITCECNLSVKVSETVEHKKSYIHKDFIKISKILTDEVKIGEYKVDNGFYVCKECYAIITDTTDSRRHHDKRSIEKHKNYPPIINKVREFIRNKIDKDRGLEKKQIDTSKNIHMNNNKEENKVTVQEECQKIIQFIIDNAYKKLGINYSILDDLF